MHNFPKIQFYMCWLPFCKSHRVLLVTANMLTHICTPLMYGCFASQLNAFTIICNSCWLILCSSDYLRCFFLYYSGLIKFKKMLQACVFFNLNCSTSFFSLVCINSFMCVCLCPYAVSDSSYVIPKICCHTFYTFSILLLFSLPPFPSQSFLNAAVHIVS